MVGFRHKNIGNVDVLIHDSKMNSYLLKPGDECVIDKASPRDGVVLIGEVSNDEIPQKKDRIALYPEGIPDETWTEMQIYAYILDHGIKIKYSPQNKTKKWILNKLKEYEESD